MTRRCLIAVVLTLGFGSVRGPKASAAERVAFNRDIRPILSEHCFNCHGPSSASRKADLRLDQRESALGLKAIVPGKPEDSGLVRRVFSKDHDEVMPPPETKRTLTAAEKELLKQWIAEGAEYERHWAFLPVPSTVRVPNPRDEGNWVRTPIDAFVLERLRREKIEPADAATREKWLRRVTFDLTGLPPTLEELDAFVADSSTTAFETVVDRLLDSPAYGERMANDWLDVARYADTFGYQSDRNMHMWPWRDWVIRAFQSNLPYDDFITWQIAGDMLPNATKDQRLATAFNRLHRQTNEGGSIEEEFRVEYVADRVRTMGTAFLGLTLECARCHDHKYDPITQKEYYSLTAFFNNIDESGLYSHFTETAPTPVLPLFAGDQEAKHTKLMEQIAAKERELNEEIARAMAPWSTGVKVLDEVPSPTTIVSFADVKATDGYRVIAGRSGPALEFDGDEAYVIKDAGRFSRVTPFTIALRLRPTIFQPRQVVLHRSRAAEDAAFRGYSLTLDDGVPVFSMVHFWPGNAIQVRAEAPLPLDEWSSVVVTYDGSSKASGIRIIVDGRPANLTIVRDRLTRDIVHRSEWGDSEANNIPLALGARFRDVGFKGGAIEDLQIFDRSLCWAEVAMLLSRGKFAFVGDEKTMPALREFVMESRPNVKELRRELRELRTEENDLISKVPQIMTMAELPGQRKTYRLDRGAYDARREEVEPTTPTEVFEFPAGLPRDRRGFARWLTDDRNPLTSRVAVNRLWTLCFGTGQVATTQDFGNQGETPSHPELLDWLARDFVNSGWDVKRMLKQIVLSSTYRQSSTPRDAKLFGRDPGNRLLARGPRHRLPAEQIRDNALAISGLLKPRIGGDSVFPYQPAGLWEEAGTGKSYSPSHGDDLYRRSLYTFWRRTSPPPTMTAFDAPSREYCVVQRERTATPLQALTILNDPQFVEAARVLAAKLLKQSGSDGERLERAFRLATSRKPSDAERAVLGTLLDQSRTRFRGNVEAAKSYVAAGESPKDETLDVVEQAAWTAVIQTLMSFDECVTKR